MKKAQKNVQNVKKSHIFGKIVVICAFFWFILFLGGCVQNASETAAEASLNQVNVIEKQIKKDCPTLKIDDTLNALRASIKTQLQVCESQKDILKEKNNTLLAILIGLIVVIIMMNWIKIKTGVLNCVSRLKNF